MLEKEIIKAIEQSSSILPEIPGFLEYLPVPGVQACLTPVSSPYSNVVSNARFNMENADSGIQYLCEYYRSRNLAFGWIVGPNSTPHDLDSRLAKAGLVITDGSDGLCLTEMATVIGGSSDVRVKEVSLADSDDAIKTMSLAYPVPESFSRYFHKMIYAARESIRSRIYLAYIDGVDDPVGCGYMTYYPDKPFALMGGAATIDEHRGRGIYTALLGRRIADANSDGIKAAIILASRSSSAPICRKAGFVKVCDLEMYIWTPEESD